MTYRQPPVPKDKTQDPIDEDETACALQEFAGDELAERTVDQQAVAMIAAARGYHKREDKPYWWGHYQRMEYPFDEWADTSGVFMIEHPEVEEDWRDPQGRERKPRRRLRLHGALLSGDLDGKTMSAIYAPPAPAALEPHSNGRACNTVTIDHVDDPTDPTEIVVTETSGGTDGQTISSCPSRSPRRARSVPRPAAGHRRRRTGSRPGCRTCPQPTTSTSSRAAHPARVRPSPCPAAATTSPTSPPHCANSTTPTWL